MNWRSEFISWMKTISIALIIIIILNSFVFQLSKVKGHSMEPTLTEKEVLIINKWVYLMNDPQIGDVVIVKNPIKEGRKEKLLVKRIIGVPGDRIEIHNHCLYRNGEQVQENYTDSVIEGSNYGPYVVAKDTYFVMGDNRHARASLDSRDFDAVPRSLITGRADIIIWPFNHINTL